MDNKLYIIKHDGSCYSNDSCDDETNKFLGCDSIICDKIYNNLNDAQNKLIYIHSKLADYKHYGYEIMVYDLIDGEYIFTNKTYTYRFNKFTENNN